MLMKVGRLLLLAAMLAGCAPMSVQDIREQGHKQSFTISANYQAAYRTLVDEMRRCMQAGMITATIIVHGELFTDIQKAVITPTMHGGLGARPLFVVDLVGIDEGTTRVDVNTRSAVSSSTDALRGVFNNTPFCAR